MLALNIKITVQTPLPSSPLHRVPKRYVRPSRDSPPPLASCHWESGAHYARTPPRHPGMKANLRGRITVANISQSGVKKKKKETKILKLEAFLFLFPLTFPLFVVKGRNNGPSIVTDLERFECGEYFKLFSSAECHSSKRPKKSNFLTKRNSRLSDLTLLVVCVWKRILTNSDGPRDTVPFHSFLSNDNGVEMRDN